ncbi:uncharacterized protein LOC112351562 isoform X2 [Selaginella moellendorffii]|uniref:uncharacterized protein LOC112351562 isoform X2 n=1 Tax=Selaginella moellendorffii TaxID=88036 RepID=UPI000D1C9C75|nr:uncharacterized protein LOC112351562 isoform X2 [Selaginella moellendorffii]|eukprot:XP_024545416.1 uncharacterized protein LOC112351562 isoform X2 [Selaginella moellendorffii]
MPHHPNCLAKHLPEHLLSTHHEGDVLLEEIPRENGDPGAAVEQDRESNGSKRQGVAAMQLRSTLLVGFLHLGKILVENGPVVENRREPRHEECDPIDPPHAGAHHQRQDCNLGNGGMEEGADAAESIPQQPRRGPHRREYQRLGRSCSVKTLPVADACKKWEEKKHPQRQCPDYSYNWHAAGLGVVRAHLSREECQECQARGSGVEDERQENCENRRAP